MLDGYLTQPSFSAQSKSTRIMSCKPSLSTLSLLSIILALYKSPWTNPSPCNLISTCWTALYTFFSSGLLSISQYLLRIKNLRVGQWKEPCIGLTQENSIENSVQDYLPYILLPNGPYKLFLAYPKRPCVCLKINMCFTRCMTSFFRTFYVLLCVMWLVTMSSDVTYCMTVWSCHSNPNPSSKNRIKENKSKRK